MEDFELFSGKSFKDLLRDIVDNAENKRDQIDIAIGDLRDQIKTINDAIVLAPLIQSYLETGIKNDEQLVKLSAVIQRLMCSKTDGESEFGLSDEEKKQLVKDIKEIGIETSKTIEPPVKIENKK